MINHYNLMNSIIGNVHNMIEHDHGMQNFQIDQYTVRPYEFSDNVHIAVSYELDPNYHKVDVQVYTGLDMLADIGGLQYSLFMLFSFLLMIFHHNKMENYLVSEMFRIVNQKTLKQKLSAVGLNKGMDLHKKELNPKKLNYFREIYHSKCKRNKKPDKLQCLKKSRMERLFEDGRNQLLEQMDVVRLFRELRILKTIVLMKVKLSKEEIDDVRENAVMMVKDIEIKPE